MTNRWFTMPVEARNHPVQLKLKRDFFGIDGSGSESRYHVVAAGRRSYKTERMKRWFVLMASTRFDERYFLAAPTRTQAKLIFWNDLLDLTPTMLMSGQPNKTDLIIPFVTGSEIHVIGLEAYKRVEGVRWHACGVSEYQEVSADFLPRTLEPILNDTHGRAILEGRPVGRNHLYDDFMRSGSDPLWQSYTWKSSDILSVSQIEAAKRTLSDEDFRREYEADFEAGSSRVYHSFGIENLVKCELDYNSPVILTCDFNATEKPMSWIIGQMKGDNIHWVKVLSHRHTNTQAMCEKLDEYFGDQYPHAMILYGDFAGMKNTSNSSYSDWQIIETHLRNKTRLEKRIKPCKSVRDRVAATNALLCNGIGQRRMFADPDNCKPLIEDWDRVQWKSNGVELDGTDPLRTHASDAVDYFSDKEYPVRGKPKYARG